jgi:hypothetical protein
MNQNGFHEQLNSIASQEWFVYLSQAILHIRHYGTRAIGGIAIGDHRLVVGKSRVRFPTVSRHSSMSHDWRQKRMCFEMTEDPEIKSRPRCGSRDAARSIEQSQVSGST